MAQRPRAYSLTYLVSQPRCTHSGTRAAPQVSIITPMNLQGHEEDSSSGRNVSEFEEAQDPEAPHPPPLHPVAHWDSQDHPIGPGGDPMCIPTRSASPLRALSLPTAAPTSMQPPWELPGLQQPDCSVSPQGLAPRPIAQSALCPSESSQATSLSRLLPGTHPLTQANPVRSAGLGGQPAGSLDATRLRPGPPFLCAHLNSLPDSPSHCQKASRGRSSESEYKFLVSPPCRRITAMLLRKVPAWISHNPPDPGQAEDGSPVATSEEELFPCHLLTVRVVRMRNVRQADIVSQTDCFVSLWLPTASHKRLRTRTISNCPNPEWNETFNFQIQTQVKNVLELSICDEDIVTPDDHLLTVLYDLTKLCFRKKTYMKFPLNPEGMEELEVEFLLEESPSSPETLLTNGVLVSRQVSCLEVHAESRRHKKRGKMKDLLVTVNESFEHTQRISHCPNPTCFHYPKYFQSQMHVEMPKPQWSCGVQGSGCRVAEGPGAGGAAKETLAPSHRTPPSFQLCCCARKEDPVCQPLDCLPDGQAATLPVRWNPLSSEPLDVRLGFSLCQEELGFLQKRKVVAAKALKEVLQLEEDLQEDEVPLIAIMATGGGTRSMTAMYGHMLGLQKLNILDCASYITGLSGATWTMATLYSDPEWSSKNLEPTIFEVRRHVVKDKMPSLFPDQLCKFREELRQRSQEGYKVTLTDFWGLLIEACLGDKRNECKLSEQRAALCRGQNPLPIYLTINVKDDVSNQDFREWCEFSPYEVGLQKYGAYIPSELFGSEFFMGRLMKRIPESRICYMLGLWSSIFSLNLLDAWNLSHTTEEFFHRWTRERVQDIEDEPLLPEIPKCDASALDTTVVIPASWLSDTFRSILTYRAFVSEFHNFLRGMQLHTDYLQNSEFSMWKDTVLDGFPNQLTQSVNHLCLLDTAFFVNSSYAPLLRPERKVDLIIHLNYCAGSTPVLLQPMRQTCEYCTVQNIPFPKYTLQDEEKNLKECYLMENSQEPDAPTVLFFPLINDTFQKYKAPGVERSPEEMEQGQVDIYGPKTPYSTKELTYTEAAFDKLVKLSEYNILNNKDKLLQALRLVVEKKKRLKSQCPP
ncbi:Cytosolic phospholipase A2 epsilon [Galemys pyrenaicus]|uniref:Phospholipase A2 n=1 Tax=Galemys pyrenaicus TaxID=202257 RepID=A0A8J6DNW2_GALPY|nr:Cytosolic phospholipase A2 epsilon [Galemys pyrenaicus]